MALALEQANRLIRFEWVSACWNSVSKSHPLQRMKELLSENNFFTLHLKEILDGLI